MFNTTRVPQWPQLDPAVELDDFERLVDVIASWHRHSRPPAVAVIGPREEGLGRMLTLVISARRALIRACRTELGRPDADEAGRQRVLQTLIEQYIPQEAVEGARSLFDDLVDCAAIRRSADMRPLRLIAACVERTVKKLYDIASLPGCVVVLDLVGSQDLHTAEIDLAMKYLYGAVAKLTVVQLRRPGDDEIVAFCDSEIDAVRLALHCQEELTARLNSVMKEQVAFRCAIYTSYLYEVQGRLRGLAIVYAARLLRVAAGGQIAISAPTYMKIKNVSQLARQFRGPRRKRDKHGIPHAFYLGDRVSVSPASGPSAPSQAELRGSVADGQRSLSKA